MSARLRHTASAALVAGTVIGRFPAGGRGFAREHAAGHWTRALGAAGRGQVWAGSESAVVLAFVGRIAADVRECGRCKQGSALDSIPPEQWVWWALCRVKATRAVIDPLVREHGIRVRAMTVPGKAQVRPLPMRQRRDRTG